MAKKRLKFALFLFILTLICGVILFYFSQSSKNASQGKINDITLKKKDGLTIRGFRFSGYHQGQKAITIKAAKLSIEKKKIGIFKFSPMRDAIFRGAEIDFHVNYDASAESLPDQRTITTKVLFSEETIPVSLLKGATSAIFEPIKINFCLDGKPITEIRAKRATFDPLKSRLVLEEEIFATAALNQLSTNHLTIYLEKGIIEVDNKFVLKTQSEQITGGKLTTDLFLKKMDEQ